MGKKLLSAILMIAMLVTVIQPARTTEAYATEAYAKGDVNGDGRINLTDAQLTLKAALSITNLTGKAKDASDADGNGKTNLKDAQMILKAALGIIKLNAPTTEPDVPVCDHVYDNGVLTTPPTAAKNGIMTYTCTKCGHKKTEAYTSKVWDEVMTVTEECYVCICGKAFGLSEYGSVEAAAKARSQHQREQMMQGIYTCNSYSTKTVTHTYTIRHNAATGETQIIHSMHEHEWVDITESVLVKEAQPDEIITEGTIVCNTCGKIFRINEYGSPDDALSAHGAHVYVDKCSGGYHTDEITTTIKHPAEYEEQIVGRRCTICNEYESLK